MPVIIGKSGTFLDKWIDKKPKSAILGKRFTLSIVKIRSNHTE